MAERFDDYDYMPRDLREYLSFNGRHFSKPLYEWAVKMMETRTGEKVRPVEKSAFDEKMRSNNITLKNDKGFDGPYVWCMGTADYLGSSVPDEMHLAKFVSDYCDDPDGSKTRAFDEFYAKTMALGIPIDWSSML
jgi:hypothetical protein